MVNKEKRAALILTAFLSLPTFFYAPPMLNRAVAEEEYPFSLISKATVVVTMNEGLGGNSGVAYIRSLLKEDFENRMHTRKREIIGEIFQKIEAVHFAGGVFFSEGFKNPGYIVMFNINDPGELGFFRDSLGKLLKRAKELDVLEYKGYKIMYALDRLPQELMGYSVIGSTFIIGSSLNTIRSVLDNAQSANARPGGTLFGSSGRGENKDWEVSVFINNEDGKFARLLDGWEKEYHLSLLLSAGEIKAISVFFNVVDQDIVEGRIRFIARVPGAHLDYIQDDAIFFSEIIKRTCLTENARFTSDVKVRPGSVDLDFSARGLKPFWRKIIIEKKDIKVFSE